MWFSKTRKFSNYFFVLGQPYRLLSKQSVIVQCWDLGLYQKKLVCTNFHTFTTVFAEHCHCLFYKYDISSHNLDVEHRSSIVFLIAVNFLCLTPLLLLLPYNLIYHAFSFGWAFTFVILVLLYFLWQSSDSAQNSLPDGVL